jgi:hypothetical protein
VSGKGQAWPESVAQPVPQVNAASNTVLIQFNVSMPDRGRRFGQFWRRQVRGNELIAGWWRKMQWQNDLAV